jgi:hypothetical protein
LIHAIVELKRRNTGFGCPRIALIIARTFGIEIDKDVVCRVLAKHDRSEPGDGGPSWLTFIGQMKDSLWSVDLFRCESIILRTHWLLFVIDQFTRRIIGTTRRAFLDHVLFWNSVDLKSKLSAFRDYYNLERVQSGIDGATPFEIGGGSRAKPADLNSIRWQTLCRGLYQLPEAA